MIFLDTHVWIWFLQGSSELNRQAIDKITNPANEIYISSISFWEALILEEKGRIKAPKGGFAKLARKSLLEFGFKEASITAEIALSSRQLEFSHEDPADRFIAATSHLYNATLITKDRRLLDLKWLNSETC